MDESVLDWDADLGNVFAEDGRDDGVEVRVMREKRWVFEGGRTRAVAGAVKKASYGSGFFWCMFHVGVV